MPVLESLCLNLELAGSLRCLQPHLYYYPMAADSVDSAQMYSELQNCYLSGWQSLQQTIPRSMLEATIAIVIRVIQPACQVIHAD